MHRLTRVERPGVGKSLHKVLNSNAALVLLLFLIFFIVIIRFN